MSHRATHLWPRAISSLPMVRPRLPLPITPNRIASLAPRAWIAGAAKAVAAVAFRNVRRDGMGEVPRGG